MSGIDDYNRDRESLEQEMKAHAELASRAKYEHWIARTKRVGISNCRVTMYTA